MNFSGNPFFIADIGANHDGSLQRAIDLIHLAASHGADAVKFQHFTAQTIVSQQGFNEIGRVEHQLKWSADPYEVYEQATLSLDWTRRLHEECIKANVSFMTSPYSLELVDHVDPYVSAYKVGSGDITWIQIIECIAKKSKPYFIATGASTIDDVIRAVNAGLRYNPSLCLMQCNTNYTALQSNYNHIHLRVLETYKHLFPLLPLGLSDHTFGDETALGAIALGAVVIEKHFTDDRNRTGPDHPFAMLPSEWQTMVERARTLYSSLGHPFKQLEPNERETYTVQRRCLRYRHDLPPGHLLSHSDLVPLRPFSTHGLHPYQIDDVVGKQLVTPVLAEDAVKWNHLMY